MCTCAEEAMELRQSLDTLRRFVKNNKNNIVRDSFVVLACPLESRRGCFLSTFIQIVIAASLNAQLQKEIVQGTLQIRREIVPISLK